jgi:peroxiredoxin
MRKQFTQEEAVKVFKDAGSNLEMAYDPKNTVGPRFNATGFPTMIVLGKSGKVEAVNVGNIGDLETRLKGQLDALVAGVPIPKKFTAARQASRRRPAEDLVGKPAPAFSVKTVDGKTVSNGDFKDHPATVLNFIAPNCGYCKRQLPNVEKVRAEYQAKGVRFVNVVQKMRKDFSNEEILGVMKGAGSQLEVSTSDFGDNKVGGQFKAVSFPTLFVVNREGKIANVNVGAKQNLDSLLKGQLDVLLKSK